MEKHYVFSAPGRTEISGNHTDHQCGCVLAAAVNLEAVAEVWLNGTNNILIQSQGYPTMKVDLDDLLVRVEEKNSTAALIRGLAYSFVQRGAKLRGFDAVVNSTVLPGSGLSSSAAFEVLFGTILNELFFDKRLSALSSSELAALHYEDTYHPYRKTYYVQGLEIHVYDKLLGEVLQYLAPQRRDVILLFYFLGYSDSEIARTLHISNPTVNNRRNAGLRRLRELLEDLDNA